MKIMAVSLALLLVAPILNEDMKSLGHAKIEIVHKCISLCEQTFTSTVNKVKITLSNAGINAMLMVCLD